MSLPGGYQLSAAEIQLLTQQLQQQAQQVQVTAMIYLHLRRRRCHFRHLFDFY